MRAPKSTITHAEGVPIELLHKPKKERKVDKVKPKAIGGVKTSKKLNMRATPIYSVGALERYQQGHENNFKVNNPKAYYDNHYFFEVPIGSYTNRLTLMVKKYLEWSGHEANRIDTKGTAKIRADKSIDFIPTQTKRGTEDISVRLVHPKHPFGVPWAIEIKALKDYMRKEQKDRRDELHGKGLWYDVVKHLDMFFELYDQKMQLLNK